MSLSPTGVKILNGIGKGGVVTGHPAAMQALAGDKLVRRTPSGKWVATSAGRRAIAAHLAQLESGPT